MSILRWPRRWRERGGEPDVALDLPSWMVDAGFAIESVRPLVFIVTPQDDMWRWPSAFVWSGLQRLAALDRLTKPDAARLRDGIDRAFARPGARMITPAVAEIIARRR